MIFGVKMPEFLKKPCFFEKSLEKSCNVCYNIHILIMAGECPHTPIINVIV